MSVRGKTKTLLNSFAKRKMSQNNGPPAKKRHWQHGLLDTMEDPDSVVKEDERVIVIKDKYPKARHHYLVVPKDDIPSIHHVGKQHEDLLRHIEKVGREVADQQKNHEFILGYHAIPSMHRLHLHVISTDFDSPCLKTKYHWNSFTTAFFLPPETVLEELKEHGSIKRMKADVGDKILKTELRCHKCSYRPKNMPDLKRHLLTHLTVK